MEAFCGERDESGENRCQKVKHVRQFSLDTLRHRLAKRRRVVQATVRHNCTCRRLRSSSRLASPCLRRQLDLRGLAATLELLSAATYPEATVSAVAAAPAAGIRLHTARWAAHSSSVAGRREVAQHGPSVGVHLERAFDPMQGVPRKGVVNLVGLRVKGEVVAPRKLVPWNALGGEEARKEALVAAIVRGQLVDATKYPRVQSSARSQQQHARVPGEDGRPAEPSRVAAFAALHHASVGLHRIEHSGGRGERKEVVKILPDDDVLEMEGVL